MDDVGQHTADTDEVDSVTDEVDSAMASTLPIPPPKVTPKKLQQDGNELYKLTSARAPTKERSKISHPKGISADWMAGRRRVLEYRRQRNLRSSGASWMPGIQDRLGPQDTPGKHF